MRTDNDPLMAAMLGVIAICIVTFTHEALGHGGVCLASGGQIIRLTSSLFHCDVPSRLIDPAGPFTSLSLGVIAMILAGTIRTPGLRLLLILIGAFSGFWEGGYLMQAMLLRQGDLYAAVSNVFGPPDLLTRIGLGLVGAALYGGTAYITSRSLLYLGTDVRKVARAAWIGATVAAGVAGSLYLLRGTSLGPQNLKDALLESGLASIALWVMPLGSTPSPQTENGIAPLQHNPVIIVAALMIFGLFAATLGLGFEISPLP